MVKRSSIKRLSSATQPSSTSNTVDIKARKRIGHLYELTDEIINAYNEINEKYVNQIYRKYKHLKEVNENLKEKLNQHHCKGCKCKISSDKNQEESEEDDEEEEEEEDDQQTKASSLPSSTTNSITTRSKRNNPFMISDIEETQNFDANDSRFNKNISDDEEDPNINKPKNDESEHESEEEEEEEQEIDEDNGMSCLPRDLQEVIKKKATKNKNAKAYLLQIPRYPALCEFLRDKSRTSFDHRPSENQVRPLIANHISKNVVNDSKLRMRLRDELREIHRSYMRTFMNDPHATGQKSTISKPKLLSTKKSPA